MNKSHLFRLVTITFFCFASLAIKSETSICNMKCSSVKLNSLTLPSSVLSQQLAIPAYPYEGFFIKI